MSTTAKFIIYVLLPLLLLIGMFIVAVFSPAPNANLTATAALAIITTTAVGIERIIEAMWTLVGMLKKFGSFWPLNIINKQVEDLIGGLNENLSPVFEQASAAIADAQAAGTLTAEKVAEARAELDRMKTHIAELKKLAPDNQRVQLISASAFQGVNYLEKKYPGVRDAAAIANQAIIGVSDFVATFKDNPGRRLISIYVGSILGLIVAGSLGLDVFKAAWEDNSNNNKNQTEISAPARGMETASVAAPGMQLPSPTTGGGGRLLWGVAFTGLLMGLGSNPTHEVIRAIQEIKKSRKSDNDPSPTVSDSGAFGGVTGGAAVGAVAEEGQQTRHVNPQVSTFSLRRRR